MKWVTRRRIHVNRTATGWLIRRFLDPIAEIVFVEPDEVTGIEARDGAIGFDAPGAKYPHQDAEHMFFAKGRIKGWDVVNEAISDDPQGTPRKSKWRDAIGEDAEQRKNREVFTCLRHDAGVRRPVGDQPGLHGGRPGRRRDPGAGVVSLRLPLRAPKALRRFGIDRPADPRSATPEPARDLHLPSEETSRTRRKP